MRNGRARSRARERNPAARPAPQTSGRCRARATERRSRVRPARSPATRAPAHRSAPRRSGSACAASRTIPSAPCRTAPRPPAPRSGRGGGSRRRTARATSRPGRSPRAARHDGPAAGSGRARRRLEARGISQATCSTSGSIAAYWPTAPESLPTRKPWSACSIRTRSRSSANAHPASFSPNVVGSAWTPCVRPMQSVSRWASAFSTTARNERSSPSRSSDPGFLDRDRERRVQDIRRGQAEVEPTAVARRAFPPRRRRRRRRRGSSRARAPRPARPSAASPRRGSDRRPRRGSRQRQPSPRAPRARRPASSRTSLRPTRSEPWRDGSSAGSLPPF